MKIYLAPDWDAAQAFIQRNGQPEATVEAEYGDFVLEGTRTTLAHHHDAYRHCPAPCTAVVDPLPSDATIVISHIDLDTVGGLMALLDLQPVDPSFWEAVAFIDMHGPHHLHEFPDHAAKFHAYWHWCSKHSHARADRTIDVTNLVHQHIRTVRELVLQQNELLLRAGEHWQQDVERKVEKCLMYETDWLRAFQTKNVFCASSYRSKRFNRTVSVTATYHERKQDITLATCDETLDAVRLMQQLFGPEAGGKPSIAKTPRGKKMSRADFDRLLDELERIHATSHSKIS